MKRFGSLALAALITLTLALAVVPAAQASSVAYVVGGWLRMRSAPSFDAETIASYNTGTAVTVLSVSGSWYYCQAPNGRTGYMYSAYLTFNAPTPVTPTTDTRAYVWAANGRDVRLREGPGLSYGVLGTYSVGTSVTILSRGTYWHYIKVGRQTGYMMSQYLTETPGTTPAPVTPVTPTTGYTAYVTSANGKKVNLRSGPGKSTSSIGLYATGTQVTVLSHGATWDYIQIGTVTGYMMNQYLTTSYTPVPPVTPVTITSVAVSSVSPTVGQTLSAVAAPSSATFSCRWYNNYGTLLSNATTYTVRDSDVGYCLMVQITGTGNTHGSAASAYTAQVVYGTPVTTQLTAVTLSGGSPTVGQTVTATAQPAGATATYTWRRSDGVVVGSSAAYTVQPGDVGYSLFCVATGTGSYTGTVASPYTSQIPAYSPTQALNGSITLPNAAVPGVTLSPMMVLNSTQVTYNWQQNGVTVGTGSTLYVTDSMAGSDIRLTVTAIAGSGYEGQISSNYCLVQNSVNSGGPTIYEIP